MQTLSGNLAESKPLPTVAKDEKPSDAADIRKPSRSQRLKSTFSPATELCPRQLHFKLGQV